MPHLGDRAVKAVKSKELLEKPVTEEVLRSAVVEGATRKNSALGAQSVRYLADAAALAISFRNGSRSSAAKADAARQNGQKGGRPRKLALSRG